MPVPGAFELPIGAMALAKTRRFACVVALGCVIRGETPHFDYVAGEAASGLQLAALETGVPVAFGVLTSETARAGRGARRQGRGGGAHSARDGGLFVALRASLALTAERAAATLRRPMSKVCAVCGKKPGFGNNRSHSMVATKRRFDPNLQRVRSSSTARRRAPTSARAASRPARSRRPSESAGFRSSVTAADRAGFAG